MRSSGLDFGGVSGPSFSLFAGSARPNGLTALKTPEHTTTAPSTALVRLVDQPPTDLPTVLLADLVPFPGPVVPISLDTPGRREAVLHAKNNSGFFLLINRRGLVPGGDLPRAVSAVEQSLLESSGEVDLGSNDTGLPSSGPVGPTMLPVPGPLTLATLSSVGILARLMKVVRLGDARLTALVHLMRRAQPMKVCRIEPFPNIRVMYPAEFVSDPDTFQALYRQVRLNLQAFFNAHPTVSDETKAAAMAIDEPSTVADFVAQHLARDFTERLQFLTELDLAARMRHALEVTIRELDLLTIGNRISQEIRDRVEKHQRDFLLREQLKAIRHELGEEKDPAALAVAELRAKLARVDLPPVARARADEELARLQLLPSESPEHNVIRSYVEWIACLPWSTLSADSTDLTRARQILDEDHYGLEEVKLRICEFFAVHQLNPNRGGSLLCFSGPPGVGKTSLGRSIARALGREFYRFSVGGMRDEAEVKGHRRTYIGALPGRILQGLRQVKTANPVFMLDELDKMGSDWRGDPSSALLEVLDPAQNSSFVDHYLDLPFDLSRVMFIATVNMQSEIPAALRDRLEIIDLPGYIPEEKLEIGYRYLLPRQLKEHGLSRAQLQVGRPAMRRVVAEYTHEAGVRELDRQIARLCRKRAVEVVAGNAPVSRLPPATVPIYLGPSRNVDDRLSRRPVPGVAVGLAWTVAGGAILFIEAVAMPGKGHITVTGRLGEVMEESTRLAKSYVASRAALLGIQYDVFKNYDFHMHFPAGAVPKDGPSAGIAATTALISLLTQRPIRAHLAMTGEITLRGEVLPVGGIREKVVAARQKKIRTIILPERNRADVEQIPQTVRDKLTFVFVSDYSQVLTAAFEAGWTPNQIQARLQAAAQARSQGRGSSARLSPMGLRPC